MRALTRLMIAALGALSLAACSGGGGGGAPNPMGVIGRADAPVEVIEYASMSCPHCADFNNEEFPKLKAKYIDTGKVRWELREMLTPPNNLSAAGFMLARCAGKDRYMTVIDTMYHNLRDIYPNQREGLLNIARAMGMTEAEFVKCIDNKEEADALSARVKKNVPKVPSGTPTFWVDGKIHKGAASAAELEKLIDAALAKK